MPIQYSITKIKNPGKPGEAGKYYAKAQVRKHIPLQKVLKEISSRSLLSEGIILEALHQLATTLITHLPEGDSVDLGPLGKFRIELSSKGADTADKFTCRNIRKPILHFQPGEEISTALHQTTFTHVIPLAMKKQLLKKKS